MSVLQCINSTTRPIVYIATIVVFINILNKLLFLFLGCILIVCLLGLMNVAYLWREVTALKCILK